MRGHIGSKEREGLHRLRYIAISANMGLLGNVLQWDLTFSQVVWLLGLLREGKGYIAVPACGGKNVPATKPVQTKKQNEQEAQSQYFRQADTNLADPKTSA
eukprot:1083909-Pelagomonas_calceolata.AAC.1